jgi:NO-binding membrane sensor protein with MHYT domain
VHTISHSHDISLVALSIAIAAMHLVLAFRFRTGGNGAWGWHKPASALLMGAAIPAMHYTGMATSQFSPASGPPNLTYALSISSLGISAVVGSALVLFLAIGASILHRRLAGNAAALARFAAIVESSHDAIVAATLDGKVVA